MIKSGMTEEIAFEKSCAGIDCSQLVFGEMAPQLGLDRDEAMRIAAAFGGGILEGNICGAVTGALMAVGYKYGQSEEPVDMDKKNAMIAKVFEVKKRFAEEFGTCVCTELLGGLRVPEDFDKIVEQNKFGTVCCKCIAGGCRIAADVLNED